MELERRWYSQCARRKALRCAAGEAKESRSQQRAQSEKAAAEEVLARVFELLSLEEHAETVADEARTRSTKHDDVRVSHGRSMRSSSSKPRPEEPQAEMGADLLDPFARHGPLRLMVDLCMGGHQLLRRSTSSLPSQGRRALHARPRSGGGGSSRRGSQSIRTRSDVDSNTGFELGGANHPLWLEIQPSGPQLQRITRSPRSRPSLHGSASKCGQTHRTCTRTHDRARRLGRGTWSVHLGDSSQATAGQPRWCCASHSDLKSTTSQCCGDALEATGSAYSRHCIATGMGYHCGPWCALFRTQQANRLRPRRQNRSAGIFSAQRQQRRTCQQQGRTYQQQRRPCRQQHRTNINIKHTQGNTIEGGC